MSNNKPKNTTPVVDITTQVDPTPEENTEAKRPSFVRRSIQKIKNVPPSTAFAVLAGGALVAAGAVLGKKAGGDTYVLNEGAWDHMVADVEDEDVNSSPVETSVD